MIPNNYDFLFVVLLSVILCSSELVATLLCSPSWGLRSHMWLQLYVLLTQQKIKSNATKVQGVVYYKMKLKTKANTRKHHCSCPWDVMVTAWITKRSETMKNSSSFLWCEKSKLESQCRELKLINSCMFNFG